ncbi:MAG: NADP-dependent oxidoreductase, partial [Pseudomonadota bacterium]
MTNRQIVVAQLPSGALAPEHFALQTIDMPEAKEGEVLLRTVLMSIDAANRSWMQGATYRDAVQAGDAMPTYALCEVIESKSPRLKAGDIVAAESVWADLVARPAHKVEKLPKAKPLSHRLSVYGIAGKTAFHGLIRIGQPLAGETIVVSAAAGSVGSYVGQIGKALGCRVIGIAGGPEKCKFVTEDLGFDTCIDYRAGGVFKA